MQFHEILSSGFHARIVSIFYHLIGSHSARTVFTKFLIQLYLNAHFKITAKKIRNWESESVNRGKTDNTMAKREKQKMIYKHYIENTNSTKKCG